ncbi:uncharacterized protein EI90DRAFT_2997228 [Cantharellus anzutake]|uniref:uncharacterized protein n=1 Tax=Cantharellus anzutake TaxID=1750568 RepID=UPI0019067532|nr:uncharacterized protein EI90DRAFT_2997228 [Cantharellus anzutake]KAF8329488.1 hypothetical protein EI90DRAFT_2997228 [Cantharellus anzutake]
MTNGSHNSHSPAGDNTPPSGTVIGPDGKPCRVCTGADWRSWSNPRKNPASSGKPPSDKRTVAASLGTAGALASRGGSSDEDNRHDSCPPDTETLGRATWTFLHTAAAYYPSEPSPVQRSHMLSLLKALPHTYPCPHCATHLAENIQQHPPENHVGSKESLGLWLCARHNDVNVRLGKEVFDCSKIDERWRDGPADGSCD